MERHPKAVAARLKTLRAFAASEQHHCNDANRRRSERLQACTAASRGWRNLCSAAHQQALQALVRPLPGSLRLPDAMGTSVEPSVPPAKLRAFLGGYGALLTVLRRQPELLVATVHGSGAAVGPSVPLLLGCVWAHLWRADDAHAAARAAAAAVRLQADAGPPAAGLAPGSLAERLCANYLRLLPDSSAWLQAVLGETLGHVVAESERDADEAEECGGGDGGGGGEPMLGYLNSVLVSQCEAVLSAVLAAAPAAPAGLRALCSELLAPHAARGHRAFVPPPLAAAPALGLAAELLIGLLVSPAVALPEAYALILPSRAPLGAEARGRLASIAALLEQVANCEGGSTSTQAAAGGGDGISTTAREKLRCLCRRCAAALVTGGAGTADADETAEARRAAEAAADALVATEAASAAMEAATPPPLEVELPLCSLRSIHSICEAQKPLLLRGAGSGTAAVGEASLLAELLEALQPAVYVLAEVGITWGDEVVALEVGEAAVFEHSRRASQLATDSAVAPDPQPAAPTASGKAAGDAALSALGVPSACRATLTRLQRKLGMLLRALPVHCLPGGPPLPPTEAPAAALLDVAGRGDGDGDGGPEGCAAVESAWEALPSVLRGLEADAEAILSDSLRAQLQEVLRELETLRREAVGDQLRRSLGLSGAEEPAQEEATGRARTERWPSWLRAVVGREERALAARMRSNRLEWLQMGRQAQMADLEARGLDRSVRRTRAAYHASLLAPIIAPLLRAPSPPPGADHDPSAAPPAAAGRPELLRRAYEAVTTQPWFAALLGSEQSALLRVAAGWIAPCGLGPAALAAPEPGASVADPFPALPPPLLRATEALCELEEFEAMAVVGVPPQRTHWVRACLPAARSLLGMACRSPSAEDAALLLGQLVEIFFEAPPPSGASDTRGDGEAGADGVAAAEWAWLITRCCPQWALRRWALSPEFELLPSLEAAAVSVRGSEAPGAASAERATALSRCLAEQVLRILDSGVRTAVARRVNEAVAQPRDGEGAPCASKWALALCRLRQEMCDLASEVGAVSRAASRLRASAARQYAQQLLCWVQSDSLAALSRDSAAEEGGAPEVAEPAEAVGVGGWATEPFDEAGCTEAHPLHSLCAGVLVALRSRPSLLACALGRAEALGEDCPEAERRAAVELLLCSLYGNRSHPADEGQLHSLIAVLHWEGGDGEGSEWGEGDVEEASDRGGSGEALSPGRLLPMLVTAYLRQLPSAWLQSTLAETLSRVVAESGRGLVLVATPEAAYCSLGVDPKEEVDAHIRRGRPLASHVRVVGALSACEAALSAYCEAVLEAVLSTAHAAPSGLRALALALASGGPSARNAGGDQGARHEMRPLMRLLFSCYVIPALASPEPYGLLLHEPVAIGPEARRNLGAIAHTLQEVVRLALGGADACTAAVFTGSAADDPFPAPHRPAPEPAAACRYLSPALVAAGPDAVTASALALCGKGEGWPPPRVLWPAAAEESAEEGEGEEGEELTVVAGERGLAAGSAAPRPRAAGPEAPPVETAVFDETCLHSLLWLVHRHLRDELPLHPRLLSLIGADTEPPPPPSSGAAPSDVLPRGTKCWYTRQGRRQVWTIVNVHKDMEGAYYTISRQEDGSGSGAGAGESSVGGATERSTERDRLAPLSPVEHLRELVGVDFKVLELEVAKSGPLGVTIVNSHDDGSAGEGEAGEAAGVAAELRLPRLATVKPGGGADRSGLLRQDDLIGYINGARVSDHFEAAHHISNSTDCVSLVVARKRSAADRALAVAAAASAGARALGTVGPLAAFFGDGAAAAPCPRLWVFRLPAAGERAPADASQLRPAAASPLARELECWLQEPEAQGWAELGARLDASARCHASAAIAEGQWRLATRAEALRLSMAREVEAGGKAAPSLLDSQSRSLRAERRARRCERASLLLALGETERACATLEAFAKAGLRAAHGIVGRRLLDGTPAAVCSLLEQRVLRSGEPFTTCYCHPPSMAVCQVCEELKSAVQQATDEAMAPLEHLPSRRADEAGETMAPAGAVAGGVAGPGAAAVHEARLERLCCSAVRAATAMSVVSVGSPESGLDRHRRLCRAAVHTALLERTMGSGRLAGPPPRVSSTQALDAAAAQAESRLDGGGEGARDSVYFPSSKEPLRLLCAGMVDERVVSLCRSLENVSVEDLGLGVELCRRCTSSSFDAAAKLLSALPAAAGPQAKLRLLLRAWDCVLGVLGLISDSPAADDYLPAMAHALLRASPAALITSITSVLNLAAREDFEEMWLFHTVAAAGLVAQMSPPTDEGSTPGGGGSRGGGGSLGASPSLPPRSGPALASLGSVASLGSDPEAATVWEDLSHTDPGRLPAAAPAAPDAAAPDAFLLEVEEWASGRGDVSFLRDSTGPAPASAPAAPAAAAAAAAAASPAAATPAEPKPKPRSFGEALLGGLHFTSSAPRSAGSVGGILPLHHSRPPAAPAATPGAATPGALDTPSTAATGAVPTPLTAAAASPAAAMATPATRVDASLLGAIETPPQQLQSPLQPTAVGPVAAPGAPAQAGASGPTEADTVHIDSLVSMGYDLEEAAFAHGASGGDVVASVSVLASLHGLMEMGFPFERAAAALRQADCVQDEALLLLLDSASPAPSPGPSPSRAVGAARGAEPLSNTAAAAVPRAPVEPHQLPVGPPAASASGNGARTTEAPPDLLTGGPSRPEALPDLFADLLAGPPASVSSPLVPTAPPPAGPPAVAEPSAAEQRAAEAAAAVAAAEAAAAAAAAAAAEREAAAKAAAEREAAAAAAEREAAAKAAAAAAAKAAAAAATTMGAFSPSLPPTPDPPPPTDPALNTAAKVFQASCPMCGVLCRFTLPEGRGAAGAAPVKLVLTCDGCAKPFAIQV